MHQLKIVKTYGTFSWYWNRKWIFLHWLYNMMLPCCFFYFLGLLSTLTKSAFSRLPLALAESTRKSYSTMFTTFLAFMIFYHIEIYQVNVTILLAFLECLVVNNVKHSQLLNYMSAIKTMSSAYGMSIPDMDDPRTLCI